VSGDATCIRTQEGWLYLVVILDLYSRRMLGWALEHRSPPP
jgi:putative transposase